MSYEKKYKVLVKNGESGKEKREKKENSGIVKNRFCLYTKNSMPCMKTGGRDH